MTGARQVDPRFRVAVRRPAAAVARDAGRPRRASSRWPPRAADCYGSGYRGPGGGMADASDLKSAFRKEVPVRVRSRAPLATAEAPPSLANSGARAESPQTNRSRPPHGAAGQPTDPQHTRAPSLGASSLQAAGLWPPDTAVGPPRARRLRKFPVPPVGNTPPSHENAGRPVAMSARPRSRDRVFRVASSRQSSNAPARPAPTGR